MKRHGLRLLIASTLWICVDLTAVGQESTATGAPSGRIDRRGETLAESQATYDRLTRAGYVPTSVRGYPEGGEARFDMTYEKLSGVDWEVRGALSDEVYARQDRDFIGRGYARVAHNRFQVGNTFYNAVLWHKRVAAAGDAAHAGADSADRDLLQGRWDCTAATDGGKAAPEFVGIRAVIDGDRLTWYYPREGGATYQLKGTSFRIDQTTQPKQFDIVYPDLPDRVDRRLYSVAGDELRWAANLDRKTAMTRPDSFDSARYQFVMSRVRDVPLPRTAIDPTGLCDLLLSGGKIQIEVPAGHFDLFCGNPTMRPLFNAPRLLRAVEGDFVAQVKMTSDWTLGGDLPTRRAFNGAGLFVWDSEAQYLRLERTQFIHRQLGTPHWYTTPIYDLDGKRADGWRITPSEFFKGRSTWLRMDRTGPTITTWISHDGKQWTETGRLTTRFPRRVLVGVHALNGSTRDLAVEFEDLAIGPK